MARVSGPSRNKFRISLVAPDDARKITLAIVVWFASVICLQTIRSKGIRVGVDGRFALLSVACSTNFNQHFFVK